MNNTLKVYWVLAYDQYYPSAGLRNVHSQWATQEEADAQAAALELEKRYDYVRVEDVSRLLGIKIKIENEDTI